MLKNLERPRFAHFNCWCECFKRVWHAGWVLQLQTLVWNSAHKVFTKHRHLWKRVGSRTRQREKWNFNPTCSEPQPQDVLWGAYDQSELKSIETQWQSPGTRPRSAWLQTTRGRRAPKRSHNWGPQAASWTTSPALKWDLGHTCSCPPQHISCLNLHFFHD